MKILIVEDNTQKLRTVQKILEQNFIDYYEVAGCGRDAYQIAREHQIDLIILDLGFCWYKEDFSRETYNQKQGFKLLRRIKIRLSALKQKEPDVIIFSDTEITESEKEGIYAVCQTGDKLLQAFEEWLLLKRQDFPKVLIIDDSPSKIAAARKVLKKLKISNIQEATYSEEARVKCESNHFDIIILDMNFPEKKDGELNGYAGAKMISHIKAIYKMKGEEVPKIIVFSTMPAEELLTKYHGKLPKEYVGQVVFAYDLEEKLKMIV